MSRLGDLILDVVAILIALQLSRLSLTAIRTGIFTWSHPLAPRVRKHPRADEPFDYWFGVIGSVICAGWLTWLAARDVLP